MAVGDIIHNDFESRSDPYTGRRVTRLTNPGRLSHHMYFYNRMVSADGRFMIIASKADGNRNLYRLDLASGDALQLTEGKDTGDFDAHLGLDDRSLIYRSGRALRRLDIPTLRSEAFYEPPPGWLGGGAGMSSDGRLLVLNEMEEKDIVERKEGWSFFLPQWEARPHCRLVIVEIETGKAKIVLDEPHCWLGHAQFRPGMNDKIMFCHEGPPGYIDARIWLVDSGGSNLRCALEHPKDITVGHEFFFHDGSRISAVYRQTTGERKQLMYLIDPDTLARELFLETPPFGHFITNPACDLIVADCQSPVLWEKTSKARTYTEVLEARRGASPEDLKMDGLFLIDLRKREISYLCHHGSSATAVHGNTQDAHPHPAFSHDGGFVVFSSDREGSPCVYKVDLE